MLNLKPVELRLSDGTNSLTVKFLDGEPCLNIAHLTRMYNVPKELLASEKDSPQPNYVRIGKLLEIMQQAAAQPVEKQKA